MFEESWISRFAHQSLQIESGHCCNIDLPNIFRSIDSCIDFPVKYMSFSCLVCYCVARMAVNCKKKKHMTLLLCKYLADYYANVAHMTPAFLSPTSFNIVTWLRVRIDSHESEDIRTQARRFARTFTSRTARFHRIFIHYFPKYKG